MTDIKPLSLSYFPAAISILVRVRNTPPATRGTMPTIHWLPIHVVRLVLSQLDSMQSLGSAILSHSIFYTAFMEDTPGLVGDILSSQMDTRVLPFARAVHEAAAVSNFDLSKVWSFLDSRLHPMDFDADVWFRLKPFQLSPTVAAAISKFHAVVQHFAQDFVGRSIRSGKYPRKFRRQACRINDTEYFRVQRALYRFQLYCNLFYRNTRDLTPDAARRQEIEHLLHMVFFRHFPQWENEQLACIHDYLERVLSDGEILRPLRLRRMLMHSSNLLGSFRRGGHSRRRLGCPSGRLVICWKAQQVQASIREH